MYTYISCIKFLRRLGPRAQRINFTFSFFLFLNRLFPLFFPLFSPFFSYFFFFFFFFFFFSALQFVKFLGFITVYRHTLASLIILIETARNIFTAILFRMNLDSGANNTDFRSSETIHRENLVSFYSFLSAIKFF